MTALILDGIVLGLQFGLLAAGLTLVYGLGGVLNLAYGQMAVISAIVDAREGAISTAAVTLRCGTCVRMPRQWS